MQKFKQSTKRELEGDSQENKITEEGNRSYPDTAPGLTN